MRIGFIGYGNMAQALSKRWATTQEIFIGGRNAESAADLAKKINASGSGSISDAVEFGDVIVLATPANAVEDAIMSAGGADAFSAKVVIDINNPVSLPGGSHDNAGEYFLPISFDEGSLAEHIAALIPPSATGRPAYPSSLQRIGADLLVSRGGNLFLKFRDHALGGALFISTHLL